MHIETHPRFNSFLALYDIHPGLEALSWSTPSTFQSPHLYSYFPHALEHQSLYFLLLVPAKVQ